MPLRKVILEPELVEEAQLLYEAGVEPVEEIAARLGISRTSFYRLAGKLGWPHRRTFGEEGVTLGAAQPAPAAADPTPGAPAEPQKPAILVVPRTLDELIPRVEAAINREFAHAEHALAHGEPRNAERYAKVMASLVRSLAELKRVPRGAPAEHEKHDNGADEPPARDLAELKAELARRLDRLRRAGDAE
jgi:hypothetical protein